MNTPKITRNNRDCIWMIAFYDGKKRMRRSPTTTDEMVARIKFDEITGQPAVSPQVMPVAATASYLLEETRITYVDAIKIRNQKRMIR